jgi:hypothetical protein
MVFEILDRRIIDQMGETDGCTQPPQEILSQLQIIGVKGIGPVPVEQGVQLAKEEAPILPFCIEGHG